MSITGSHCSAWRKDSRFPAKAEEALTGEQRNAEGEN